MLWLKLFGCASMMGLTELPTVPDDFPVTVNGEVGHVTALGDKQIAVDFAYESEDEAHAGWEALQAEAVAKGFTLGLSGKREKRNFHTFEGDRGKLDLACCLQRADRQWLVFVTWWRP